MKIEQIYGNFANLSSYTEEQLNEMLVDGRTQLAQGKLTEMLLCDALGAIEAELQQRDAK